MWESIFCIFQTRKLSPSVVTCIVRLGRKMICFCHTLPILLCKLSEFLMLININSWQCVLNTAHALTHRNSINKVLLLLLLLMKAAQSCLTPWPLWTIQSMEFSRPEYWTGVGSLSLRIFPTQGSNPGLSHLQVDSLPAEPQGKPKNIGMGSLSLLQQIFLTQELNQGLLHCRLILYKLSFREALLLLKKWENCLKDSYNLPKVTKLPSGKNQYLGPGSKHMVLATLL